MKAETLSIVRFKGQDKQTLGAGFLHSKSLDVLMEFKTVELPWLNNQKYISCITPGTYIGIKHDSPKFGMCIWIQNVPGRSEILIHPANYWHDLRGCAGPGEEHKQIDGDGYLDVTNSVDTMKAIMKLCNDTINVIITDAT